MVLWWFLLVMVGTGVVWYGSGMLDSSTQKLAVHYELPPIVQGGVVAAVGSSFPELSSVVVATLLHGEFDLGVSAIAGSAIFNITVIPALSALCDSGTFTTNRDLVYKEAQFYMLSVSVLLTVFSLAVIYNPVHHPRFLLGEMTSTLAWIAIFTYLLYLFTQWQDTRDFEAENDRGGINPLSQWLLLALSLMVITAGVEALVRAAVRLGEYFNTPSFLWGLTVIAIGTSLPDTFYSIQAARRGQGVSSIANVLGSNIFDLLVAVPAGVILAGSVVINFSHAVPMLGMLTVVTVVLFTFMRTELILSRVESVILLVLYGAFLVWAVLESFGGVNWIP